MLKVIEHILRILTFSFAGYKQGRVEANMDMIIKIQLFSLHFTILNSASCILTSL